MRRLLSTASLFTVYLPQWLDRPASEYGGPSRPRRPSPARDPLRVESLPGYARPPPQPPPGEPSHNTPQKGVLRGPKERKKGALRFPKRGKTAPIPSCPILREL